MKRLGETRGQLEDMGQYFMTTTMATVTLPRATAIFLVSRRSTRPPRYLHQISFYALINILRKNLIGCYPMFVLARHRLTDGRRSIREHGGLSKGKSQVNAQMLILYVIRKLATLGSWPLPFCSCLYCTKYQKNYIIGKLEIRLIELPFFQK